MSRVYLEDLDDAIETAIQFELFVKFKEKSAIFRHSRPQAKGNNQKPPKMKHDHIKKDERTPIHEVKALPVACPNPSWNGSTLSLYKAIYCY